MPHTSQATPAGRPAMRQRRSPAPALLQAGKAGGPGRGAVSRACAGAAPRVRAPLPAPAGGIDSMAIAHGLPAIAGFAITHP